MTAQKKPRPNRLPPTASSPGLLVDGSDQVLRRIALAFAVLGWQLAEIRTKFGRLVDVSPFQYVVLQAIARVQTDEPWTVALLAQHFHVTTAYVSMELRPLTEKGLIRSLPNPSDRRSKFLSLSEKGERALLAMLPVQQKVNDLIYAQFDAPGLVRQCAVVERMVADAEKANKYLSGVLSSRSFLS